MNDFQKKQQKNKRKQLLLDSAEEFQTLLPADLLRRLVSLKLDVIYEKADNNPLTDEQSNKLEEIRKSLEEIIDDIQELRENMIDGAYTASQKDLLQITTGLTDQNMSTTEADLGFDDINTFRTTSL